MAHFRTAQGLANALAVPSQGPHGTRGVDGDPFPLQKAARSSALDGGGCWMSHGWIAAAETKCCSALSRLVLVSAVAKPVAMPVSNLDGFHWIASPSRPPSPSTIPGAAAALKIAGAGLPTPPTWELAGPGEMLHVGSATSWLWLGNRSRPAAVLFLRGRE